MTLNLDDGGKDRNKRGKGGTVSLTVGGYVATTAHWSAFEEKWSAFLAEKNIPYWHMTDCRAGTGHFIGMPDERERLAYFQRGCGLIHAHTQYGIAQSLSLADYYKTIDPARLALGSPVAKVRALGFAIASTLMQVRKQYERARLEEKIGVVFAKGTDGLGTACDFVHWLMEAQAWWGDVFTPIVPGPPELPGLQAADCLANAAYNQALWTLDGGDRNAVDQWTYPLVNVSPDSGHSFDIGTIPEAALKGYAAEFDAWARDAGFD